MLDYADPARRRFRAATRVASAAIRGATWSHGIVVPTYWWDGHPNFGDDLTPWILPFYGIIPVHREPDQARLAGVGSILEFMPERFNGFVWGSGLKADAPRPMPDARMLAVRGELTRERIGAPPGAAVGDPGLLVSRLHRRPRPRWSVGFVPHGHHRSHRGFLALIDENAGHHMINVHQRARSATAEIASCRLIVTTSLHGLVTADAFGIPAVWTVLDPHLDGEDFKFRDYETVVSPGRSRFVAFDASAGLRELESKARAVNPDVVDAARAALETSLAALKASLDPGLRFPQGVWMTRLSQGSGRST